jgi:Tol biopolymer transport system component
MSDQKWGRVLEVFETVWNLPDDVADAQLELNKEDPAVILEVSLMLKASRTDPGDVQREDPVDCGDPRSVSAGSVVGRYEVTELIGRGSSGEVYSGRDRELGRLVALKFMTEEYAKESLAERRFLREAQAVSALNHPNIVTLHEVIAWKSSPVIVTELVEGAPLRTLCGERMAVDAAIRIGRQILEALSYAHAKGIIHRDLKPENVMVRTDGYVKVLDFGLARRLSMETGTSEESSTAGLPVGTLRYMSPEQCRGEAANLASDVFATGLVLYELLSGQHPFQADSPLDTAHAITRKQPRALMHANPEIGPALNSLIMRMLAKEADARPSAMEAAQKLAVEVNAATGFLRKFGRFAGIAAFLLLAMALAFALTRTLTTAGSAAIPGNAELQLAPLANFLGVENSPTISNDGNLAAFAFFGDSDPVSHIYVKDLSASRLVRLTNDVAADIQPALSRDGAQIAFLRRVDKGRLSVMVTTPSPGGREHQVAEVADLGITYRILMWDVNGANLFVTDALPNHPGAALFEIPMDGGTRKQITFPHPTEIDSMPMLSPDGHTLGFVRLEVSGRDSLWTKGFNDDPGPVSSFPEEQLTKDTGTIPCWSWSPDGSEIWLAIGKSGRSDLWRRPVGGGPLVRFEGILEPVRTLAVAGNARRLLYAPGIKRSGAIWQYSLRAQGEAPQEIISSATYEADPHYSPDGKYIAFQSLRAGQGQTDLWVSSSDGSNPRKMSDEPGEHDAGSPAWSPDGRWIAFDLRLHDSNIYVLDILGGKPRRLTLGPNDGTPSWSRDGRTIYFSSDRDGTRKIWKIPASGGEAIPVTSSGGFESVESSDSRFLYFTKNAKTGFWRKPLTGGEEEAVPGLRAITDRYWEGSKEGIYFISPAQPHVLQFFHFSTGKVTRVLEDDRFPDAKHRATWYHGISIAPDGHRIIIVKSDTGTSNITIVSNFH